jgi:mRNA interferase HigB
MFNIITRKTLLAYCKKYPKASNALLEWYYEFIQADFKNFQELKSAYGSASLVGDDRVVFNIMGNIFVLSLELYLLIKRFK